MKRFTQILETVKTSGTISEKDILLLKSRYTSANEKLSQGATETLEALYDFEVEVEQEQATKGFAWLWNQYQTPNGKERKNNPFGYREIEVLEEAKISGAKLTFDGFYCVGRYNDFYVPIYTLFNDKGSFQYVVYGGEIHIIG